MKQNLLIFLLALVAFVSCNDYNNVLKSNDLSYRYEAAKQYYYQGDYNQANTLLVDLIAAAKGTNQAEESLFLLGLSAYKGRDYEAAATYFKKYYESYPRGTYVEEAHLYAGRALYAKTPDPRLDQTDTYTAITELRDFIEAYPGSRYRAEAEKIIFELQDKLIEKEFLAAKLYYDLGGYFGNCGSGESNYQACIITAQNAINDYPYTPRREEFAILILKSKFELAAQSIDSKKEERYHAAIDEYYGFTNEFPDSKFMPKARALFDSAKAYSTPVDTAAVEK